MNKCAKVVDIIKELIPDRWRNDILTFHSKSKPSDFFPQILHGQELFENRFFLEFADKLGFPVQNEYIVDIAKRLK